MLAGGAAVLGLGALCGLWVVFQRWIARMDPGQRGVEGGCGTCHDTSCERREGPEPQAR